MEARRKIKTQWDNIERYLVEYRGIAGDAPPGNIAQIAAHFAAATAKAGEPAQPQKGGATYNVHVGAAGLAIGNGAQVIQPAAPGADTAALHARLQRLDDVQLDTLCLVNFPAVYDRFGRGLRRDEKINLLLDHCRRSPKKAARLAGLLK